MRKTLLGLAALVLSSCDDRPSSTGDQVVLTQLPGECHYPIFVTIAQTAGTISLDGVTCGDGNGDINSYTRNPVDGEWNVRRYHYRGESGE